MIYAKYIWIYRYYLHKLETISLSSTECNSHRLQYPGTFCCDENANPIDIGFHPADDDDDDDGGGDRDKKNSSLLNAR